MQLRVLPAAQQPDPSALAHWETFAIEYPEVTEKQLWLVTLREPPSATDCLPHQLWFVTLRELLIATDCHRVPPSATECHRVPLSATDFHGLT